jgi:serine protease Do
VLVSNVVDGSPADESGLQDGDIITAIGDEDIGSVKEAVNAIKSSSPGDEVEVVILREGNKKTVEVKLGEREENKITDLDLDILPDIQKAFKWTSEPQGFLGVEIHDMSKDLAGYFDVGEDQGVLVLGVTADGPAEKAGMKAGDVILEVDGKQVSDADQLVKYVRQHDPGDRVDLRVKRKGRIETAEVELGKAESPAKALVRGLTGPGKTRVIIPGGRDMEMPEVDKDIEIYRMNQHDLQQQIEQLRKDVDRLKEEIKEIRKS